jgi:hypothetical protein
MEQNFCQVDDPYCKQEDYVGIGHWLNSVGHSVTYIHDRERNIQSNSFRSLGTISKTK